MNTPEELLQDLEINIKHLPQNEIEDKEAKEIYKEFKELINIGKDNLIINPINLFGRINSYIKEFKNNNNIERIKILKHIKSYIYKNYKPIIQRTIKQDKEINNIPSTINNTTSFIDTNTNTNTINTNTITTTNINTNTEEELFSTKDIIDINDPLKEVFENINKKVELFAKEIKKYNDNTMLTRLKLINKRIKLMIESINKEKGTKQDKLLETEFNDLSKNAELLKKKILKQKKLYELRINRMNKAENILNEAEKISSNNNNNNNNKTIMMEEEKQEQEEEEELQQKQENDNDNEQEEEQESNEQEEEKKIVEEEQKEQKEQKENIILTNSTSDNSSTSSSPSSSSNSSPN